MGDKSAIEWTDATLKYCWRCRRELPRAAFGKDRTRYDRRAAICRECRRPPKQMPLLRRTRAEYERARYATDEQYRAERRQKAHSRARGIDPVPFIAMELLNEDFGGLCAYCPAPATTWDHIVAVSKGGRTVPGNIVPACVSCNSRKKDRDVDEFLETEGVIVTAAFEAVLGLAYQWGILA